MAFTFDGSSGEIYVNGTLAGTSTIASGTVTYNSTTPYVIGSDNYTTNAYHGDFYGSIDDVRLYSRVINGSEIQAVYNNGAQ